MRLGALILAGGRSQRMGRPKESLPIADTTLLGWQCRMLFACTEPVVVVTRDGEQELPPLPSSVDVIADSERGRGPLEAIARGLQHLGDRHGFDREDAAFVIGCDQPFVTAETVRWLRGQLGAASVLMPRANDRLQPLLAIYRLSALPRARELLAAGTGTAHALANCDDNRILDEATLRGHDPTLQCLRNLNHPAEYEAARKELGPSS